jgi:RNA polymerase sigma-70 factor (ECF subfamily)
MVWQLKRNKGNVGPKRLGSSMTSNAHGLISVTGATALDEEVRSLLLAKREREAADLLLARLLPELRPFLHRLLGNIALADEAHSATCERLWHGIGMFRWECSLRTWSYIIARREASRCRVRHARDGAVQTTLSAADELPASSPASATQQTVRREALERMRATLSDEDRDLLVLRVERGLAWKEIAAAFLEDSDPTEEVITREAARLRQRFRAIRTSVANAIARQKKTFDGAKL